jgi:hypothetical protein
MKRILVLMIVVALMGVMLAMSAAAAFAAPATYTCTRTSDGGGAVVVAHSDQNVKGGAVKKYEKQGYTCTRNP